MKKKFLIKHKDIANIGYYFLKPSEEELFLKNVNDDFAFKVGQRVIEELYQDDKAISKQISLKNILELVRKDEMYYAEIITEIRNGILEELKQKRRDMLLSGAKH